MPIDITDVTRRVQYAGSGTGPYNFTFQILDDDDVAVYQDDTLLVKTTDYTVTINVDGTGSITTVSSIPGADNITIIGARPYARLTDFSTGGDFFADDVNDELDGIMILIQQLREAIGRALAVSSTGTYTGSLIFPAPGAGEYLRWNAGGTALETVSAAPDEGTFTQSGTGAVARSWTSKVGEFVSVKDFGAVGDDVTDDTAAIQAAHDAVVSSGDSLGFSAVAFPAGTYVITSLTWSPLVPIHCLGSVVLQSSIASGKCLSVSTEYGNWDTAPKQLAYNSNTLVSGGKLVIENTLGSGSNTATGIFFGDDGVDNYSAESISLHGVSLRGWSKSHRFGSHAYLITFIDGQFRNNADAIFNDLGSYTDRCERMTYVNCTFANNTNAITGDTNCGGDFSFVACSFDYNTTILPNITQAMVLNIGGGSHLEGDSASTMLTVVGGSVNLDGYYAAWLGAGSGPVPIIAKVGAVGFVRSRGMTALTPTSATLFELTSASAILDADDDYKQNGGSATSYITNTGGGWVEQHFSILAANQFLMGARGDVKVRAIGLYTHEFTKTGVLNGATVDLFSVGPIASWASGRLTVQSTSAGILTAKIVDFVVIGAGTIGGTNITATEDYSGGGSAFTVVETINSPSGGYNKISVTNTSGATCSFNCSLQINYLSNGGAVTLL